MSSAFRASCSRPIRQAAFPIIRPPFSRTHFSSCRVPLGQPTRCTAAIGTTTSKTTTHLSVIASGNRHIHTSPRAFLPSKEPTVVSELVHPASPPAEANPTGVLPQPDILDRILPEWARGAKPYLLLTRIDKPIGSLLLYWPCAWSITMASTLNHLPISVPLYYMGLFGAGALIMRGAGCTINDMWDRKYDAAVERTKNRPLARGDVTQFQALTFLGGQLGAGLLVLTQLNWYSIVLGASSLGLVVLYPFMKRITYYPQLVFGLTFNWGAFLGWSAVAGAVDWTVAVPMYVGGTLWGIAYDMIYAHQDKKDDVLAGVKSMALRFPDNSRTVISALSASFVSCLALTGHIAGLGPAYYAISVGGAAAHLAWQCVTVDFDSREDCWSKFKSNGWLGGLIWLGVFGDYLIRVVWADEDEEVEAGKEKEKEVGE